MKEIGLRAAKEIYNRQDFDHSIDDILDEIELTRTSLWQYKTVSMYLLELFFGEWR